MTKKYLVGLLFVVIIIGGLVLLKARPPSFSEEKETSRAPAGNSAPHEPFPIKAAETTVKDAEIKAPLTTDLKMKILDDILSSRNDNDPRLDSELTNLSEEDKQALEKKYSSQNKEKLNERGTIVFLLGRNIESSKDLVFFKQVAQEKPCRNFTYCDGGEVAKEGEDHDGANDVTLAYPQVMVLKSLENFLNQKNIDYSVRQQAMEIIHESANSKNSVIKNTAQNIMENSGNL
jgi:hypothetical protein